MISILLLDEEEFGQKAAIRAKLVGGPFQAGVPAIAIFENRWR